MQFSGRFIFVVLLLMVGLAFVPDGIAARDDISAGDKSSASISAEIQTIDGRKISGEIQIADESILVKTGDSVSRWKLADIASITSVPSTQPTSVDQIGTATGLKAEYFDDQDLRKLRLVRYDPAINFQWGLGAPDPSLAIDFSARWTGKITADYSEVYTFQTFAEDGVRFWVDGKLQIDQWNDVQPFKQECTFEMERGKKYNLRLEYRNKTGEATVRLRWQSKTVPSQIVSPANLFPPDNIDKASATLPAASLAASPATAPATQPLNSAVVLISPVADRWKVSPGTINLEAATTFSLMDIARVEFYSGKTLLGVASTAPFKYTWTNVPHGHHQLTARLIDRKGTINASPEVSVNVAANGSGSLPLPWGSMRLGATPRRDSCGYSGGLFTIRAGGGELRGAFDSGYFIAQPLDEDGQITIRVGSVAGDSAPHAACGVMFRESLSGDSRYVALVAGRETVEYLCRREPASWVAANDMTRATPCYLRLVRLGKLFKAYISDTGTNWQLVGSDQIGFSSAAFVGIITTSRADEDLCNATVDHVNVQIGSPPMDATGSGVRFSNGSFISGTVSHSTNEKMEFITGSKKTGYSINQVSRIYLNPVPLEMTTNMLSGHTGILLSTGDFYEGEFQKLTDGKITIDSIVFGPKTFPATDVLAIVLRDAPRLSAGFEVQHIGGNIYRPHEIKLTNQVMILSDDVLGEIPIALNEIKSLKRITANK